MKNSSIQRYNYHKWANNRILRHLAEFPEKIYSQEIKSVFPSIQVVLQHMYQTDGMWLSVMSGDDFSQTMKIIHQLKEKSENLSLPDKKSLYEELNQKYENFLTSHTDLEKPVDIHHPRYGKLTTSVSDLVSHVVNHGTYHRGNITAMLRQQGHPGVPTDYIFYLYDLNHNNIQKKTNPKLKEIRR